VTGADDARGAKAIDPTFKLVFSTVATLSILLLAADVVLSVIGGSNDLLRRAVDTIDTLGKAALGAILGLLGGKTTS
jgi:hypothetical protein